MDRNKLSTDDIERLLRKLDEGARRDARANALVDMMSRVGQQEIHRIYRRRRHVRQACFTAAFCLLVGGLAFGPELAALLPNAQEPAFPGLDKVQKLQSGAVAVDDATQGGPGTAPPQLGEERDSVVAAVVPEWLGLDSGSDAVDDLDGDDDADIVTGAATPGALCVSAHFTPRPTRTRGLGGERSLPEPQGGPGTESSPAPRQVTDKSLPLEPITLPDGLRPQMERVARLLVQSPLPLAELGGALDTLAALLNHEEAEGTLCLLYARGDCNITLTCEPGLIIVSMDEAGELTQATLRGEGDTLPAPMRRQLLHMLDEPTTTP